MNVPLLDLKRQYEPLRSELEESFMRIFDSGQFILGPDVAEFEREVARFTDVHEAIGVSSGTDALIVALRAIGIQAGDQVLTTPFTFFATMSAILSVGAEPVFADIDPDTFNIDPERVAAVLEQDRSKKIKALIPVHLYGQAADMRPLMDLARQHRIAVIEDAAQAIGTHYEGRAVGSIGEFGCFSFFPTKNLGGLGDSGLVTTNDPLLAEKARRIRTHGSKERYYHELLGGNFRIDTIQAAALRIFLPRLPEWIEKRQHVAAEYDSALSDVGDKIRAPIRREYGDHSYHQYTVRITDGKRDRFQSYLNEKGVSSSIYYPVPCHLQAAVKNLGLHEGMFPATERASQEVISLPIFPEMTDAEIAYVAETIRTWARTSS